MSKKNNHRKRSNTQDSSISSKRHDYSLTDGQGRESTPMEEREYTECENIVTLSQVSQKQTTSETHDKELNVAEENFP